MSFEAGGRTRIVLTLCVFAAAFGFHASYAFHGLPLYDGGILLDGADRILRGQVFARDFHAPYGPGSYYVLALWFLVFGPSLASWTWLAVAIQAGANAALFALAARWTTPGGALVAAALLAIAHGALHKSFLLLALVLALVAAALLDSRSPRRDAAAGALAGAAFLLRYDVGAFAFVALLAGSLLGTRSGREALGSAFRLGAGFSLAVAPCALVLLALGASPAAWWSHALHRVGVMQAIDMSFPWPWRVGDTWAWLLFAALLTVLAGLLGLLAGALARRVRGEPLPGDASRVAVALLGLLALNQTRLLMGINRLFQVAAPAYLALADLLSRRGRGLAPRLGLGALALALLAWVHTHTSGLYPGSYTARIEGAVPLDVERTGVWVRPREERLVKALVAAIAEHVPQGEPIGMGLRMQLAGFLADRPHALPYAEPAYYLRSERFQREAIDALEAKRVRLFVRDPSQVAGFTLEIDAPLLDAYLRRHYELAARIGPFELLRRAPR